MTAKNIDDQRRGGVTVIMILMWVMVALVAALGLWMSGSVVEAVPAAVGAAVVTGFWKFRRDSAWGRILSGVLLMAQISLMIAEAAGHPWQIDLHMTYFALLAVLIIYCDWKVILAATATVALHHLVLSFAIPSAVFPGSASLARVILHAVILLTEAAALLWVAHSIVRMFQVSNAAVDEAEAATSRSVASNAAAEAARTEADVQRAEAAARDRETQRIQAAVVELTGKGLGALAAGDLTYR
ncbi:methyl-accepting chemotaxis protein, partial [Pseudomonas sp. ODNR1LW]|nr:methyl-accepting chemotaxis protein [Pseudomonas sp. ODNR1LW]